jgi:hypothetical protein
MRPSDLRLFITLVSSGSSTLSERAGLPAFSTGSSFLRRWSGRCSSFSPLLAARSALPTEPLTVSRSARISSVLMISMSRIGSTVPSTWVISSPPGALVKQRTTWRIASTSRMWREELVAQALALAGALDDAGDVHEAQHRGMIFCDLDVLADDSRGADRGSGPRRRLARWWRRDSWRPARPALVNALKRVDLPTFGSPTMPASIGGGDGRGPRARRCRRGRPSPAREPR